jgi:tetratricopeptide (TPR) repeat protein/predicted aspartyl protease
MMVCDRRAVETWSGYVTFILEFQNPAVAERRLISRFARTALFALIAATPLLPAAGSANCTIESVELPVYMSGLRPHVKAGVNGEEVSFLLDSGAFYSMIAPAAAERLKLPLRRGPDSLRVYGVGGRTESQVTRVERFTLKRTVFNNVEFIVAGNLPGGGAVGLLGQNFLGLADIEYDLANGLMRFHYPSAGCKSARLAYWARSQAVAEVELEDARGDYLPHLVGVASVNGARVRVVFDTGASVSILSTQAARRAGLTTDTQGVVSAGKARGVGNREIQTWVGPVRKFALGEEQISDTRLRFGDIGLLDADMLIGADFFLSHRIYFAKSQGKVYFTYNGGPVFNVSRADEVAGELATGEAPTDSADMSTPTSADGFARRAAAFAARKDYRSALADLDRACELEPAVARHFAQRGEMYLALGQASPALHDLTQALRLDPSDLGSWLSRAQLHFALDEKAAAREDLAALDAKAPPYAETRLDAARLYLRLRLPGLALKQLDLWIAAHGREVGLHEALNLRCWARALLGSELDKALSDCESALRSSPDRAGYLDSRALVHLRMGKFDKAIDDYDAALRLDRDIAWSWYGRGISRLRRGEVALGQADIAAAKAIDPAIEAEAQGYGVTP